MLQYASCKDLVASLGHSKSLCLACLSLCLGCSSLCLRCSSLCLSSFSPYLSSFSPCLSSFSLSQFLISVSRCHTSNKFDSIVFKISLIYLLLAIYGLFTFSTFSLTFFYRTFFLLQSRTRGFIFRTPITGHTGRREVGP